MTKFFERDYWPNSYVFGGEIKYISSSLFPWHLHESTEEKLPFSTAQESHLELPRLKTPLQVSFKNTKLLGANYFSRKEKTFTAGRFFFHSISTGDSTGDSPGDSTEDSPEDSTEDSPEDSLKIRLRICLKIRLLKIRRDLPENSTEDQF